MGLHARVSSIIAFLRAGYPNGVPSVGYVGLLALLPRRTSDDEVEIITTKLIGDRDRSIDGTDVGVEITRITDEMPSLDDIDRVQRRLDAMRWAADYRR